MIVSVNGISWIVPTLDFTRKANSIAIHVEQFLTASLRPAIWRLFAIEASDHCIAKQFATESSFSPRSPIQSEAKEHHVNNFARTESRDRATQEQ